MLALCREGFDHAGMMAIAKLYHAHGEGGVDYFIHSFLKAIKDVALDELANWTQAVGVFNLGSSVAIAGDHPR